jgi:hypothetical protein
LIERHHEIQNQLLGWYLRVENQATEPLFVIEPRAATGRSLLEDNPELVGTFSGGVLFSNEYMFESLLLYWFGCLMLYTSMARVYKKLHPSGTEGIMRLTDITANGQDALKGVEGVADSIATKVCQTIEFCQRATISAPGFQTILLGLWAAQQFFDGRSPRKFRWCQMIIQALQKDLYLTAQ